MEKKLKCPYCGRSMELKNGKTLDYWYSCTECDVDTPAARGRALAYQRAVEWTLAVLGTCDALSDALGIRKTHPMETVPLETLLGEVKKLQQTLGNRVLTLDEVTADAEKEDWSFIWIERKYDEKYALQYCAWYATSAWVILVLPAGEKKIYELKSDYGTKWRCWEKEPTPEEMQDTPWEAKHNEH